MPFVFQSGADTTTAWTRRGPGEQEGQLGTPASQHLESVETRTERSTASPPRPPCPSCFIAALSPRLPGNAEGLESRRDSLVLRPVSTSNASKRALSGVQQVLPALHALRVSKRRRHDDGLDTQRAWRAGGTAWYSGQ